MTADLRAADVKTVPIDSIKPHPDNARQGDVDGIASSIAELGLYRPVIVQRSRGWIIAGNHTWKAAKREGRKRILVGLHDCDDATGRSILAADNRWSDLATYDDSKLAGLLTKLTATQRGLAGTGFDDGVLRDLLAGLADNDGPTDRGPTLADRFLVPPFSVLDARQGYWRERKRAWLTLGIQSEIGRPQNSVGDLRDANARQGLAPNRSKPSTSGNDPQFYYKKQQVEQRLGRQITTKEFLTRHYSGPDAYAAGTSVFDPVLCELAYRWWCPPAGRVLDPFAGGSVRGIVATRLGRPYVGIDLRAEQVAANEEQAEALLRKNDPIPDWRTGDSRDLGKMVKARERFDFLFSCPPYFDLEKYGDDERDLSNSSWDEFGAAYRTIIAAAAERLRPGRFACFVVGNVREHDETGALLDLGALTVQAFEAAGCVFYQDAILITSVGSLALRASSTFQRRKLGRCHQQVLVFLKPPLADALAGLEEVAAAEAAALYAEPFEPDTP